MLSVFGFWPNFIKGSQAEAKVVYQELIVFIQGIFFVELPEDLQAFYKILLFIGPSSNQSSHKGH